MHIHKILAFLTLITLGFVNPAYAAYWNLFNLEGESAQNSTYVTYNNRNDMLMDINRVDSFAPNNILAGRNIVGSGSDGTTYWNLFNLEGESALNSIYVTYSSLLDMLMDINRVDSFAPDNILAGRNIVGSGATLLSPPVAPVPIPSTILLFGTGLAGLAAYRSKFGKQNLKANSEQS